MVIFEDSFPDPQYTSDSSTQYMNHLKKESDVGPQISHPSVVSSPCTASVGCVREDHGGVRVSRQSTSYSPTSSLWHTGLGHLGLLMRVQTQLSSLAQGFSCKATLRPRQGDTGCPS
jgi:hypothetical protein